MKYALFTSLALAVSSSAFAEMSALDDFAMSKQTGQAGVDLTFDFNLDIGEVTYTDTDITDGGSLALTGVALGGWTKGDPNASTLGYTNNIDNFTLAVDIDSSGTLILDGGVSEGSGDAFVDVFLGVDQVSLKDANNNTGAILVDNLDVFIAVQSFDTTIGLQDWTIDGNTQSITTIDSTLNFAADLRLDMTSSIGVDISAMLIAGDIDPTTLDSLGGPIYTYASLNSEIIALDSSLVIDFQNGAAGQNKIDILTQDIFVGGNSIGRVFVDDLDFSGVELRVAGH